MLFSALSFLQSVQKACLKHTLNLNKTIFQFEDLPLLETSACSFLNKTNKTTYQRKNLQGEITELI